MEKQTAERYAQHVREQADQADAALNMAAHITGHHWSNLSSALSLAQDILENGAPLKLMDGTEYGLPEALDAIAKAHEAIFRDTDALREALRAPK